MQVTRGDRRGGTTGAAAPVKPRPPARPTRNQTPRARRPRPARSCSPAEVARDLMTLLGFMLSRSGERFYALVDELDLSITQIKTLHLLENHSEEVSVKELAKLLGLSLPAASRTVDGLLRRGYVERREDDHDRRMKRIRMSAAGGELALELHRERLAGLEDIAATLTERERRELCDALASLIQREDIAACRPPTAITAQPRPLEEPA